MCVSGLILWPCRSRLSNKTNKKNLLLSAQDHWQNTPNKITSGMLAWTKCDDHIKLMTDIGFDHCSMSSRILNNFSHDCVGLLCSAQILFFYFIFPAFQSAVGCHYIKRTSILFSVSYSKAVHHNLWLCQIIFSFKNTVGPSPLSLVSSANILVHPSARKKGDRIIIVSMTLKRESTSMTHYQRCFLQQDYLFE